MTTLHRFLAVTACTLAAAGAASAQVGTGFPAYRPPVFNPNRGAPVAPPVFNPGAFQLAAFANTPTVNPYAFGPTPPVAVRQPGWFLWRGPDLQVNPRTGTVYRPQTGVVTMADGSTFFRVPGTGTPNAAGQYATGTGVYFNPNTGAYYNPASGTIARPGTTGLLPYIW